MALDKFTPVDSSLFFSRNDPSDPRWGERVRALQMDRLAGGHFVLAGYPDDEGIRLNGGRPGAHQAPSAIRKYLYRMTPALEEATPPTLWDAGDLRPQDSLPERHQVGRVMAQSILRAGGIWLSLGGGHDYAYADGAGFLDFFLKSDQRPIIINFDAHLDVRPADRGFHSGTPFYRLLNDYEGFDFVEVGIQSHCNSKSHLQWAKQKGAKILLLDDLLEFGDEWGATLINTIGQPLTSSSRPCFLSIDIDGFSSAFAMGCSQSWATGLTPNGFLKALRSLQSLFDVRALGIYEVSPALDSDDRTSKWAAQILHSFISHRGPG